MSAMRIAAIPDGTVCSAEPDEAVADPEEQRPDDRRVAPLAGAREAERRGRRG